MTSGEGISDKGLKALKLKTPEWAEKYKVGEDAFWLHDTWYQYAVLSRKKFHDDFPDAPKVFAMNDKGFLAVSDTYPGQYRNLGILHEAKEFSGQLTEESCVETLKYELDQAALLQVYDVPKYLEFRLAFFKGVIEFYEKKEPRESSDEALLVRLHKSLEYLEEQLRLIGESRQVE